MYLLGIASGFHDAAAALLSDGQPVAAVELERLSRRKHDAGFPDAAMDACLTIAGIGPADLDAIVLHEKPMGVIDRHLRSRLRAGPRAALAFLTETPQAVAGQLGTPLRVERWCRERDAPTPPVLVCDHHLSHAAAAYYTSPFSNAAVLTVDGVGEWATTTIGAGHAHRLSLEESIAYPDSIGLLYSAFTAYCGFRANSGEGELMGLAPFGEPRFADRVLETLVCSHGDGSFRVDERYFAYTRGRRMTSARFHRLFGGPPRPLGSPPGQREADLAASVQTAVEQLLLGLARRAHELTGADSLCLGGGVALNCVANARLADDGPFEHVWVPPAPGDGGSALGAALWAWHEVLGAERSDPARTALDRTDLGPSFDQAAIERWLTQRGEAHIVVSEEELSATVADRLADGAIIGWFQGAMEFGPRALGHRSILADPRSIDVHARLNDAVKERASFRPFAPAVLADRQDAWFEPAVSSPFMTRTAKLRPEHRTDPREAGDEDLTTIARQVRSTVPAITHVDHSARIQTVTDQHGSRFAALLRAFEARTGCPMVLNTSFNHRDEPIVCTPGDALGTFRRTGLDLLVLERCLVEAR